MYHIAKDSKVKQCRAKDSLDCKAHHQNFSEHFEEKELAELALSRVSIEPEAAKDEVKVTPLKVSGKKPVSSPDRLKVKKTDGKIIEFPLKNSEKKKSGKDSKKEPKRPSGKADRVKTLEEKIDSLEKDLLLSRFETSVLAIRASEAMAEGSKYKFIESDFITHDKLKKIEKCLELISESELFSAQEYFELKKEAFACEVSTFLIKAGNFFTYRENFKKEMPWLNEKQKAKVLDHNTKIDDEREKIFNQLRIILNRAPEGFNKTRLQRDFNEISNKPRKLNLKFF